MRWLLVCCLALTTACSLDLDLLTGGDGGADVDAGSADAGDGGMGDGGPDAGPPGNNDAGSSDAGPSQVVVRVEAGGENTCARTSDGRLFCWGANDWGQLGPGGTMPDDSAVPIEVPGGPWTDVSVGDQHVCAIAAGAVWCWGRNSSGQTGGASGPVQEPFMITAPDGLPTAVGVAAGGSHSCAIFTDDAARLAYCWGLNTRGQLGDQTFNQRANPEAVDDLADVDAIGAGHEYSCALSGEGVYCWGDNTHEQLGTDLVLRRNTADRVPGAASEIEELEVGPTHVCAYVAMSSLWSCWGDNRANAITNDDMETSYLSPRSIGEGLTWRRLAVAAGDPGLGRSFTCVVQDDLNCRGAREHGQLGLELPCDGMMTMETQLTTVPVAPAIDDVTAGARHLCVVSDGTIYCTGDSNRGQIAQPAGTCRGSFTPVTLAL